MSPETNTAGHRRPDTSPGSRIAVFLLAAVALAAPAHARYHQRGNLTLSLSASLAHTRFSDRSQNFEAEVTDEYSDTPYVTEPEDYTDQDVSLYLSSGYFVTDHLELGLSGSTYWTFYPEGNQSDLSIYDFAAYGKYFFDGPRQWTPYVKIEGGLTFLETGDYRETGTMGGGSVGLEFLGMGSVTWYVELKSEFRDNGGDLTGTEWRNEVYLGVTFYPNLLRKRGSAEVVGAGGPAAPYEPAIDPETGLHPAQVEVLKQMGVDLSTLKRPAPAAAEPPKEPGAPVAPSVPHPPEAP